MGVDTPFLDPLRHDVHGTYQRRGAIHTTGRSFEHLYALNIADVYREVKGIMPRLWVADVDAVE